MAMEHGQIGLMWGVPNHGVNPCAATWAASSRLAQTPIRELFLRY